MTTLRKSYSVLGKILSVIAGARIITARCQIAAYHNIMGNTKRHDIGA